MAPIRVKSFNVEEGGKEGRRAEAVWPRMAATAHRANSAPVFIDKTSYVDCGKGANGGGG